ncbi:hypothetical protein ABEB36_001942 [Hypothenemus hampei]|uniref:EGF-like domain-containing protein n=1 Tax=Hypothenemus hampei TaxID=57062 RepID=A0ABD1FHB5_HYPHA
MGERDVELNNHCRTRPSGQAHVMGDRPPREGGARGGLTFLRRNLLVPLATPFYRFLARFSGRRRAATLPDHKKYPPPWQFLVLHIVLVSSLVNLVGACSSRSTPKPRPPAPTPRPNITFLTYPCPPAYAAWFCLNGATCFTVKIQDSLLYNCECAPGYQGSRCEYKDLDGSYIPSQRRFMLETASIAGGATIAVFSAVILCLAAYLRWRRRKKFVSTVVDQVDSPTMRRPNPKREPIFGIRPQGQNLISMDENSASRLKRNNNVPVHEPNLPQTVTTPQDRGDHPATLLRGEPPWGGV